MQWPRWQHRAYCHGKPCRRRRTVQAVGNYSRNRFQFWYVLALPISARKSHRVLAQYYNFADEVIILGDCGIQQRGRGLEMKHKSAAILKTLVNDVGKPETASQGPSSENFDRLTSQARREAEAEVDLARKTGDFAIHSTLGREASTSYD